MCKLCFVLCYSSLSSTNKERLEIGSGTLEMALDEEFEKRIQFMSKIWNKKENWFKFQFQPNEGVIVFTCLDSIDRGQLEKDSQKQTQLENVELRGYVKDNA